MCFEHQLTIEHVGLMKYQRGVEATSLIQLDLLNHPPVLPVPFAEAVDLRGVAAAVDVAANEEHLVRSWHHTCRVA